MITYEHLLAYAQVSSHFLRRKKENADTKLGYAINKMAKKVQKALKPISELEQERNEKVEEINIDCADTDKTTNVIVFDITKDETGKEVRNYRYTKENLKKRNKLIKETLKEYEVRFNELLEQEAKLETPYFCTEIPSDLTAEERQYFEGIVIGSALSVSSKQSVNGTEKQLQDA